MQIETACYELEVLMKKLPLILLFGVACAGVSTGAQPGGLPAYPKPPAAAVKPGPVSLPIHLTGAVVVVEVVPGAGVGNVV